MPTPLLHRVDETSTQRTAPDTSLVFSKPPQVRLLSDILPDDPLLMMGAGPVPIPEAVARANSVVINHLGETMSTIITQVKEMGRYVFQTKSNWVMGVAGPGSAAMEMAISNLVLPGHKVLRAQGKMLEELAAQPAAEGLGRLLRQPDVLIHVEGGDARPVDPGLLPERREHVALAGRRGEDHAHIGLSREQLP